MALKEDKAARTSTALKIAKAYTSPYHVDPVLVRMNYVLNLGDCIFA